MSRILVVSAGVNGLAAVIVGAMAQHAWAGDPVRLGLAETGIRYGLPHAAALLALAALPTPAASIARWFLAAAGASLAAGATLFSFSLYALALAVPDVVRFVTPVGGTMMTLGWTLLLGYGLTLSRSGIKSDNRSP